MSNGKKNLFEMSNSIKDTSKKRKCLLRRDVVNGVLHEQVPIPDPPVGVDENDTLFEALPDIVDHTADWDDANSTDNDAMHPDEFVHTTDQKWSVALLKILDNMHAPDSYAFGQVLG